MTTFNPPQPPSLTGLSKQTKVRTLSTDFGDGYTQRAGDGLNTIGRTVNLTWNAISPEDADTIEAFFIEQNGYKSFDWVAPRDSTPKKWIVTEWTRDFIDFELDGISATFTQVFDL